MKKIVVCAILALNFIACTQKVDLGELISKRNAYQAECDYFHAVWDYRQFQKCRKVDKEKSRWYAEYDEFMREQTCRDSIEIINIEIEKYKNGKR